MIKIKKLNIEGVNMKTKIFKKNDRVSGVDCDRTGTVLESNETYTLVEFDKPNDETYNVYTFNLKGIK